MDSKWYEKPPKPSAGYRDAEHLSNALAELETEFKSVQILSQSGATT
jgi:hypothetical protein